MNTLIELSTQMELFRLIHISKDVDEITKPDYEHDWESLRKSIMALRNTELNIVRYKCLRRVSSVVSNATNGIEPPEVYLSIKKVKERAS